MHYLMGLRRQFKSFIILKQTFLYFYDYLFMTSNKPEKYRLFKYDQTLPYIVY